MNVGDVVGNYRITEVLGEGGMGVVYLGSHELIGREAAIKVLLPSLSNKQDVVQRFFNEAKTTTSIKHPGIVEVFDFGYSDDGHAFIVMEVLEGETLEHRIRRLGRLPAEKAIALFTQIARALGAAHKAGVIHRDLKPANIYIVSDPDVVGGERAKILDFGIAKLRNSSTAGVRTASGQLMGAPDYMAPEQCLGASEVDPRADLYALGCMLFHAVTGKTPFTGQSFSDVLAAHVSKPSPRASTMAPVSAPLDDLIFTLMKKSPDDRPQTTDELLDLLSKTSGAKLTATGMPPRVPKKDSKPPPIPAAKRRTVMAPSQPPPVPGAPASIGPDGDSSAPLPPLPRPKPSTAPPPIPRAAANARTLYTDGNAAPLAPAPAKPVPGPGPLNDPRLAKTIMPGPQSGNPILSVPGPQPAIEKSTEIGPSPPPRPAHRPAPAQPPRQPPQQPAQQPPAAMGPRGTMAIAQPQAPVYPRAQPNQPVHHGRPDFPVEMGPRRGHSVRPMPPQTVGTSSWKVGLGIVLIVGASAGGFFIYKAATGNKGETVAAATADAGTGTPVATKVDAMAVKTAVAVDAAAAAPVALDAAVAAAAIDAGAAAPAIDAAVVAAKAVDAAPAPVPVATPDAAPTDNSIAAKSGRVIDPDLKSAPGGDDGVKTVVLKIESRPPGADVIRKHDNLRLGKTPLEYVTRKFNANENFEVRLGGYYSVSIKMSTFRDGKRLVPLLAKPK